MNCVDVAASGSATFVHLFRLLVVDADGPDTNFVQAASVYLVIEPVDAVHDLFSYPVIAVGLLGSCTGVQVFVSTPFVTNTSPEQSDVEYCVSIRYTLAILDVGRAEGAKDDWGHFAFPTVLQSVVLHT